MHETHSAAMRIASRFILFPSNYSYKTTARSKIHAVGQQGIDIPSTWFAFHIAESGGTAVIATEEAPVDRYALFRIETIDDTHVPGVTISHRR